MTSFKTYSGKYKSNKPCTETKLKESAQVLENDGELLFLIERSNNANAVCYSANVNSGSIDEKDPVKVQWVMWAKDSSGKTREALTFIENNTAYGITVTPGKVKDHYKLIVVSLKAIEIDVYVDPETQRATAKINIDGNEAKLVRIYVYLVKNWVGVPSVEYTDLFYQIDGSDEVTTKRICA